MAIGRRVASAAAAMEDVRAGATVLVTAFGNVMLRTAPASAPRKFAHVKSATHTRGVRACRLLARADADDAVPR